MTSKPFLFLTSPLYKLCNKLYNPTEKIVQRVGVREFMLFLHITRTRLFPCTVCKYMFYDFLAFCLLPSSFFLFVPMSLSCPRQEEMWRFFFFLM